MALALLIAVPPAAGAADGSARVERLLAAMTLDEKLAFIHGATEAASSYQGQAGYLPGVPRLGIPSLRLADGPPGVLTREVSTALPATMALAATFSREDAQANGVVIGRDARALGIDLVLEPYINIYRDPGFSRSYNTYGEDPALTGQIGAALVSGIQSQGVMAQAKHYIAFDGANDVQLDGQTLHEIYAAPFADVVHAGVASIMCSYNQVNGQFVCGNAALLNGVLRGELGFRGFVTSDWGATHAAGFINAGLDMEMPGELRVGPDSEELMRSYFSGSEIPPMPPRSPEAMGFGSRGRIPEEVVEQPIAEEAVAPAAANAPAVVQLPDYANLRTALRAGSVTEAAITQAARRILLQMQRFGLLDGHSSHSLSAQPVQRDAAVGLRTAEDGAVLLKNDGALPLSRQNLGSLLLIGPGALQTVAAARANEQALGRPARQIGAVEALRRLLRHDPAVHIQFRAGNDMNGSTVPAGALSHDGEPGLVDQDARGQRQALAAEINFTRANGRPLAAHSEHRWSGSVMVPADGVYEFNLQMLGGSGALRLDGQERARIAIAPQHGDVLQAGQDNVLPTPDGLDNLRRRIELTAGSHALLVTAIGDDSGQPLQVRLNWATPEKKRADYQAAITAARSAGTVVVFAWSRNEPVMALPGNQNQLIADVAGANPNTIVVLNTGDPVAMPWLDKVRAVLQLWYTGDEGGWAAANLLLGRANPAGRLPFTWPRRLQDTVAHDASHPERASGGVDGRTIYSEGLLVGYRWFDRQGIDPLFAFGYGLSYTRFEYQSLAVRPAADGGLDVSFTLRNIGPVRGDEVPQVYLTAPESAAPSAQFAERSLVAFARVALDPRQSKRVLLHLPPRRLQYWSEPDQRWQLAAGRRSIQVGSSSRDIRLTAPTG
ncbi:MAG TPA: glycoside hydrolase family 3 C-terminal domain-containing protein [Steroidobacteraceae bacterium]|nr:glycoside hydrolase family 3 C-terminal domain-containing protein [Steroidobacteraceae bacterium]